jgi:hypothetical protein
MVLNKSFNTLWAGRILVDISDHVGLCAEGKGKLRERGVFFLDS